MLVISPLMLEPSPSINALEYVPSKMQPPYRDQLPESLLLLKAPI
jgi:hypothetical protein